MQDLAATFKMSGKHSPGGELFTTVFAGWKSIYEMISWGNQECTAHHLVMNLSAVTSEGTDIICTEITECTLVEFCASATLWLERQ